MFNFDIDIENSELIQARVDLIESQSIVVGIMDKSKKAAIAAPLSKGFRKLPNYSKGMNVRKIAGRDPNYTQAEQMLDLEEWGLFSDALADPANKDLIELTETLNEIFITGEYTEQDRNMVCNWARALIRNRIVENRLGNNSPTTVEAKGFNRPLMDTGELFTSIKAWLVRN